jgi:hypothetical protein
LPDLRDQRALAVEPRPHLPWRPRFNCQPPPALEPSRQRLPVFVLGLGSLSSQVREFLFDRTRRGLKLGEFGHTVGLAAEAIRQFVCRSDCLRVGVGQIRCRIEVAEELCEALGVGFVPFPGFEDELPALVAEAAGL